MIYIFALAEKEYNNEKHIQRTKIDMTMINSIHLNNFTCFIDNELEFSRGINVLIGKNGTGKTHIMKCLAAVIKANHEFRDSTAKTKGKFGELLSDKLIGYFKPDSLGHLVNKYGNGNANIAVRLNSAEIEFNFSSQMLLVKTDNNSYIAAPHFLYIPPREMFSLFDGFISLYEKREISFDETYIDLAKALNVNVLRNTAYDEAIKLVEPLLNSWKIKVEKRNNRFYIIDDGKEYEAHLVAEGLRKVATLLYLVGNGELKKNSILFWDEPEANLNPSLISVVSELLCLLASQNIQIFIATHDYLLTHRLSLQAEYRNEKTPEMSFFSFTKEEAGDLMTIEKGATLLDIDKNPILEEYAAFYDLEDNYKTKKA